MGLPCYRIIAQRLKEPDARIFLADFYWHWHPRQDGEQVNVICLLDLIMATAYYNNAWAIENKQSMHRISSNFKQTDHQLQAEKPYQKASRCCLICRSM